MVNILERMMCNKPPVDLWGKYEFSIHTSFTAKYTSFKLFWATGPTFFSKKAETNNWVFVGPFLYMLSCIISYKFYFEQCSYIGLVFSILRVIFWNKNFKMKYKQFEADMFLFLICMHIIFCTETTTDLQKLGIQD